MTARPRIDKNGRQHIYYGWVDPRSGKERSLDACDDFNLAKIRAETLNAMYLKEAQAAFLQRTFVNEAPEKKKAEHTWGDWCARYMQVIQSTRNLAESTIKGKQSRINKLLELIPEKTDILDLNISVFSNAFSKVREEEKKPPLAVSLRSCAIDMMNEARREGWFPEIRGNPAKETRNTKAPVMRTRLTLTTFLPIVKVSETRFRPWVANSMWLALLSAQRREDVGEFRFKRGRDWEGLLEELIEANRQDRKIRLPHPYPHIYDDALWVVQQKTGKMIRIPLDLRLGAVGMSLGDAVKRCRDTVASPYLIHHDKKQSLCLPGDPVRLDTISKGFEKSRRLTEQQWAGTPPSFHEVRSLAARLYTTERGEAFAQAILGHSDAKTTAIYRDPRGVEWVEIQAS